MAEIEVVRALEYNDRATKKYFDRVTKDLTKDGSIISSRIILGTNFSREKISIINYSDGNEIIASSNNLCNLNRDIDSSWTQSGITWIVYSDGSVYVSGTAENYTAQVLSSDYMYLPKGEYYFSVNNDEINDNFQWQFSDEITGLEGGLQEHVDLTEGSAAVRLVFTANEGESFNHKIYPQISYKRCNSGELSLEYENWREKVKFENVDYNSTFDFYNDFSSKSLLFYPICNTGVLSALYTISNIKENTQQIELNRKEFKSNVEKIEERLSKLENSSIPTVTEFLNEVYPIGSIYLSITTTNPNKIFGIGSWTLISQNRMLIGAGDKYATGATGGSETVTLSKTQVPKVSGTISLHNGAVATNIEGFEGECFSSNLERKGVYMDQGTKQTNSNTQSYGRINFDNGGTNAAHNNMPPYYAVYMWQRIS